MEKCLECNSLNNLKINTYKRKWTVCKYCGSGWPVQKSFYPLSFLPIKAFKKNNVDEQSIYDYFVNPIHIEYSRNEAESFLKRYVDTGLMNIKNQKILDVSGGNGEFINAIKSKGATVCLTEINQKSVEYANERLGVEAFEFNFNEHKINEVIGKKFNIVFLRACLMFCKDLHGFVKALEKTMLPGGKVFVQYAVYPTIGTLLRVQLDEFSYAVLRQPESIIKIFEANGFSLEHKEDETDSSLYAYDHDLTNPWLFLHYLYELPAVLGLRKNTIFKLRARDRRRANLIFKKM